MKDSKNKAIHAKVGKGFGPDMSSPKARRHAKRYNELVFGKGERGKANKHWFETGEHT